MALEFMGMVAFDGFCGTRLPRWRYPTPRGPLPTVQSAVTRADPKPHPWWPERFFNNIYLIVLTGLLILTAATHPEQAFSLRYGPFMLVPTINILAGLYYNNVSALAATKVKM